jgi:para-nitrobenzyl esterase
LFIAAIAITLLQLTRPAVARTAATVAIEQGQIVGKASDATAAYLGIPYAAPPVERNRWRGPQPAEKWHGIRAAVSFEANCSQEPGRPYGPYAMDFMASGPSSEDCLFLNVWTPRASGKKLPVLVWIHGGGFSGGSGSLAIFNGSALASKGVVVVTINYRLGPFGYLAHPELSAEDPHHSSGTYGLQDQIAALKWVQRNIAQFGGDSRNVTVAGESAGAISTNGLILSPLAVSLFHRAVVISGAGMGFPAPGLREAEQKGVAFAASLGARDLVELRAVPADKILAAVARIPRDPAALTFPFWPVVDGWVLPGDPDAGASQPRSAVPVLTGFNADENFMMSVKTVADFHRYVKIWFGAHADRVLALYPHETDDQAVASSRVLARDRYMASQLLWVSARTRNSKQQIFQYFYDHPPPTASGPDYGSFHSAGVPYFFGNLDPSTRPYGPSDRFVSEQFQAYLLAFMKTGKPNIPGRPDWPVASSSSQQVMALGLKPGLRDAVSSPARLAALRSFVADGGRLSLF